MNKSIKCYPMNNSMFWSENSNYWELNFSCGYQTYGSTRLDYLRALRNHSCKKSFKLNEVSYG